MSCVCLCLVTQSCPTLCNPMDYRLPRSSVHGDSPGENTGVGCHALLQGIFPSQGSKPGVPHCRRILYYLSHQRSGLVGKCASQALNPTPDMAGELTDILQNYHGDYHGDFHGDFSNSCSFALGIQWVQTMQSCVLK